MTDETPNNPGDLNPEIADAELDNVSAGAGGNYCNAASCQPNFAASLPPITP